MRVNRAWLHQFARVVRHVSLDNFTITNTCILTSRLGQYVLDEVGVPARPQPVFVDVWNMKGWHLAQEGVPVSQWPDDAWSIHVGEHGQAIEGWHGHLVLVVRQPGEPRLMIDLTADQFDRPNRDLHVEGPVFMGIGEAWTPQDPLSAITPSREEPNVILSYRPMPDPDTRMPGSGWRAPTGRMARTPCARRLGRSRCCSGPTHRTNALPAAF